MLSVLERGAWLGTAVRLVSPEWVRSQLEAEGRLTIVDVRGSVEFHGSPGHIPGARSIPAHQLSARSTELERRPGKTVVLVSLSGSRARVVAATLLLAGVSPVCALDGGLRRWIDLGFPLERSS